MGLLANTLSDSLCGSPAADVGELCPDIVTVTRALKTQGATGGTFYDFSTASATTVASNIACNIQNVRPVEIQTFGRRGIKVSNVIYFAQALDLKLGDRIQDPEHPARYFVVTFVSDMGGEHLVWQAYVNLIQ